MADLLIIAPDGRIVACPRHLTTTKVVDDEAVTSVNVDALKPGWSVYEPPATKPPAPVHPAFTAPTTVVAEEI